MDSRSTGEPDCCGAGEDWSAVCNRSWTFLGNVGRLGACHELSPAGPSPCVGFRLLLPHSASRCGHPITSSYSDYWRSLEPHHLAAIEPGDVAFASQKNLWTKPSSEEVRWLSRGDGRPSVPNSGQCCRNGDDGPGCEQA